MKFRFIPLCSLFFVILFSGFAFAQSVVVTSKKMTYTRPKPLSDYKKTFTVNYPKIKAATPALSKKIETAISYESLMNFNLQEEKTEIQWLEEADYEVKYNKNGLLGVTLSMLGSGAYPSVYTKAVVVNTKTGTLLKPSDVFTNLAGLAAKLKKMQTAEITKAKAEIKAEPDYEDVDADQMFENADFTVENIDEFRVGDEGVTFLYDYGFQHVNQALEPSGEYALTWAQLKPYVKKGGVFEKLAK